MALGIDNTGATTNVTAQIVNGTTTLSFAASSATCLIVTISTWNNGGTATGCLTVLYGIQSMTLESSSPSSNADFYTEIWSLLAPTTGTANIVATVAGKTDKLGLGAVSFTGGNTSTAVDVAGNATGTAAAVTQSVTTTANSEYLVDAASHLSANTASSSTGTQIYNDGAIGAGMATQYGLASTAGSNSLSWTYPDPGDKWAYSVIAVKAASGGGSTSTGSTVMMMGI